MITNNNYLNKNLSFAGKTRIYALTDSHQQTRDKCILLSKVLEEARKNKNVLALDGGDMFKGIYPPELEVETYLTLKKLAPDLEIVFNIGNNDPGYNKESYDFFKKSMKTLADNGIHVISANTWDKFSGNPLEGVKPYAIINRDGDKILVTGFCINNLTHTTYGLKSEEPKKILENLKQSIIDEKPDELIILNHDWYTNSQDLVKFAKKQGLKVDLLIGGHEHGIFTPDKKQKIYYPVAFNQTMYQFDLIRNKGKNRLTNIKEYSNKDFKIAPELNEQVTLAEKREKLLDEIAPSTLNLTKSYSNPCALGTFLADAMKKTAGSDIALFSTGHLMAPLPYEEGKKITEYDLRKTTISKNPIEKITVNTDTLKQVFENALKNRMIQDRGNARFLQCSQNVKIIGEGNSLTNKYKVNQIFINNKPLLDEATGKALNPSLQITCAVDSYIAEGGQEYTMLKDLPKEQVIINNQIIKFNDLLKSSLQQAAKKYEANANYPKFEIIDLIDPQNAEIISKLL